MLEKEGKRPKAFGSWLTFMMLKKQIPDQTLAKETEVTLPTVWGWKGQQRLPKVATLLKIVEFFAKEMNESPEDMLLEALDSIHQWRQINKEYRARLREQNTDTENDSE